jgi:hypothetical protein
MIGVDRQVCEFVPRGRREALAWYWSCGDYGLLDALSLRPLEVAPSQVRRCQRVRAGRPGGKIEEYAVDFTQTAENRIVAATLPHGFPRELAEDILSSDYMHALTREHLMLLTRGLTLWWFWGSALGLAIVQAATGPLVARFAPALTTPTCAGACAAFVAHDALLRFAGFVPMFLGTVLPPLRYRWLVKRPRLSPVLRSSIRTELLLLFGLNAPLLAYMTLRLVSNPDTPLMRILTGR